LGRDKWTAEVKGTLPGLKPNAEMNAKVLVLSCWFLCPIVLPFIISFLVIPVYKDYYTISAAPAFYLLLALGIYNIRRVVPIILSLGVLVILITPCLRVYYVRDMNEQWQEAAAYVEQNSTPADVIVFGPMRTSASNRGHSTGTTKVTCRNAVWVCLIRPPLGYLEAVYCGSRAFLGGHTRHDRRLDLYLL
jgi:hypothetical protein